MLRALPQAVDAVAEEDGGSPGAADVIDSDRLHGDPDGGWRGGEARLRARDAGALLEGVS